MESRSLIMVTDPVRRFFRSRAWRILATGIGFAVFGVVGLVLSLSLFPVMFLAPVSSAKKSRNARRMIQKIFWLYIRLLRLLGLLSFELHNQDKLSGKGQLIIANHPSLLDVVFLMSMTPANCVVKASLWRNPFTAIIVRTANYIRNDDPDIYQRCLNALAEGESLIIFPEGTRSTLGQPLKFQRGPAYIAIGAQPVIRPVVIRCEPTTLVKNQAWYQISETPPHFSFYIKPPLTTCLVGAQDQLPSNLARHITREWQNFFTEHLSQVK